MMAGRGVLTAPRVLRKSPRLRGGLRTARPAILLLIGCVLAVSATAGEIFESFSTDPAARNWRVFGDSSLFRWNSTNQNLDVTWDSSRTNSYFWLPLRTILTRNNDFSVSFDLTLRDIAIGTSSNRPYTFQIAIGFLNTSNATRTNFFRGAGQSSLGPRNLVEFNYFPDSGFGATFAPTIVTTNNLIFFSDNHPLVMTTNDLFGIDMRFTATNRTLKTTVTKNGLSFGPNKDLTLGATADFRCDALAIMSYSDATQVGSPAYWGSILAHGAIDNLIATVPDPAVENFAGTRSNGAWRVTFTTRTNWTYALERTSDFSAWATLVSPIPGSGGALTLTDSNAPSSAAFYRVLAAPQ